MKSVQVLMIPAPSRFFVSEMQVVCGVKDRVQYSEGFLKKMSIKEFGSREGKLIPALEYD